jgi:CS domain
VVLPAGTSARDIDVQLKRSSLALGIKGEPSIVSGDLVGNISVTGSFWTTEDLEEEGRELSVTLEKVIFYTALSTVRELQSTHFLSSKHTSHQHF